MTGEDTTKVAGAVAAAAGDVATAMTTTPAVDLRGVTLAYAATSIVHEFDLAVAAGETVVLLGPSGSGKSSLLATVAGFLAPIAGEVRIGGRLVDGPGVSVPPEQRSVGVVFQSDALWPHLTVLETVAYPIRRRGASAADAEREAGIYLERLGIAALASRRPAQLSGGEQQRTGLARALARRAAVYLLDEPTAHLDTALKVTLQREMADACRETGSAVVIATHDVAEALAVADRVAIIRDGWLIQVGAPLDVYQQPVDAWSAHLTGVASVLRATPDGVPNTDGSARVLVRPDWAGLGGGLPGLVEAVSYRGSHTDTELATPFGRLIVRTLGAPTVAVGEQAGWHLRRSWPLPGPEDQPA